MQKAAHRKMSPSIMNNVAEYILFVVNVLNNPVKLLVLLRTANNIPVNKGKSAIKLILHN